MYKFNGKPSEQIKYAEKGKGFPPDIRQPARWSFTIDKEGRINYFNTAEEKITDLSASEVMGAFNSPALDLQILLEIEDFPTTS